MRTKVMYVEVGIALFCILAGAVLWYMRYESDIASFLLKAGPIYLAVTFVRLFFQNKKDARKL